MDEVHWGLKRYIHGMKNFDYQNVNALDSNMVSLYLLCVYHVCFCSATKSFAIQRNILNHVDRFVCGYSF